MARRKKQTIKQESEKFEKTSLDEEEIERIRQSALERLEERDRRFDNINRVLSGHLTGYSPILEIPHMAKSGSAQKPYNQMKDAATDRFFGFGKESFEAVTGVTFGKTREHEIQKKMDEYGVVLSRNAVVLEEMRIETERSKEYFQAIMHEIEKLRDEIRRPAESSQEEIPLLSEGDSSEYQDDALRVVVSAFVELVAGVKENMERTFQSFRSAKETLQKVCS